jgi:hypothetical protein
MNRNQQDVIEYLQEEIRVLKELMAQKPRFNDDVWTLKASGWGVKQWIGSSAW